MLLTELSTHATPLKAGWQYLSKLYVCENLDQANPGTSPADELSKNVCLRTFIVTSFIKTKTGEKKL